MRRCAAACGPAPCTVSVSNRKATEQKPAETPAPTGATGATAPELDGEDTALAKDAASRTLSAFASEDNFAAGQRMARALAASTLVPAAYQGNIPNVLIAMELANRIGASVLMVMQSLDIIHGRPSWRAMFLIATVNACGRFTPIRFRWQGTEGKDDADQEDASAGGFQPGQAAVALESGRPRRCDQHAEHESSGAGVSVDRRYHAPVHGVDAAIERPHRDRERQRIAGHRLRAAGLVLGAGGIEHADRRLHRIQRAAALGQDRMAGVERLVERRAHVGLFLLRHRPAFDHARAAVQHQRGLARRRGFSVRRHGEQASGQQTSGKDGTHGRLPGACPGA